jgi:hypothetical protein
MTSISKPIRKSNTPWSTFKALLVEYRWLLAAHIMLGLLVLFEVTTQI